MKLVMDGELRYCNLVIFFNVMFLGIDFIVEKV